MWWHSINTLLYYTSFTQGAVEKITLCDPNFFYTTINISCVCSLQISKPRSCCGTWIILSEKILTKNSYTTINISCVTICISFLQSSKPRSFGGTGIILSEKMRKRGVVHSILHDFLFTEEWICCRSLYIECIACLYVYMLIPVYVSCIHITYPLYSLYIECIACFGIVCIRAQTCIYTRIHVYRYTRIRVYGGNCMYTCSDLYTCPAEQ